MAGTSPKAPDESPEPQKVAAAAVREADPADDSPVYPVERLTGPDAYALTGHEGHIVAGALSSVSKKNLTIDEAKAAVKAWLKAPVKEA